MKTSAGIMFYRQPLGSLYVLLVHPSGDHNKHAKWSIPKGEVEEGHDEWETAVREVAEEIGIDASKKETKSGGDFDLGSITYKSGRKRVRCFALMVHQEPAVSSWEIDKVEWFTVEEAKKAIHPDQAQFVDRLVEKFA